MAWLCPKHGQRQDTHEMDSNWEGGKARSKNYLVKNSDERVEEDAGLTWGESQAKAQNRIEWQRLILCPSRDQEIV